MQFGFKVSGLARRPAPYKTGGLGLAGLSGSGHAAATFTRLEASINEIIDMTGAIPLFDKIDADQIGAIAAQMQVMHLDAGEQLFAEGEHGDFMCFIVAGTLDVFKRSQHGRMVYVSMLNRGRSIGEMALTDNLPRSATVVAQTACTLLVITRQGFEQVLEDCPRAGVALLKSLSRVLSLHLRRASGQLVDARESSGSLPLAPVLKTKESRLIGHILNKRPASQVPMVRRFI